jgi:hypothetical protein
MSKEGGLTREEEERLLFMSFLPCALLMIGTVFYLMWLMTNGTMEVDLTIARNIFLLVFPSFLALATFTYEVLSSFKTKRTFLFRLKRFLRRMILVFAVMFLIVSFWILFQFLLSSVLSARYLLLLPFLCTALVFAALAFHPKTRQIIQRLTGEHSDNATD